MRRTHQARTWLHRGTVLAVGTRPYQRPSRGGRLPSGSLSSRGAAGGGGDGEAGFNQTTLGRETSPVVEYPEPALAEGASAMPQTIDTPAGLRL